MLQLEISWRKRKTNNNECLQCDYMAMNNIIVSDVFGKTKALIELGNAINADVIVDPYDGKNMNFIDEVQAYSYFAENIGLDSYLEMLSKTIKECSGECILIGFSVGASIIWQLSQLSQLPSIKMTKVVKGATCFYGSQIRHLSKLSPKFEVKLIFPKSEPHFDVVALQHALANKEKVKTMQVDYLHGFMNTHSNNFNDAGYEEHIELLRQSTI